MQSDSPWYGTGPRISESQWED
ncbi:hypothetical protein LINPERHAP2_LOCUS19815 [Linum perenne]